MGKRLIIHLVGEDPIEAEVDESGMNKGRGQRSQKGRCRGEAPDRRRQPQRNEAERIGDSLRLPGEDGSHPRQRGQRDDDVGRGARKALAHV